jgi:uncharacterized membrane protein YhaH (DUF805 family)
MEWYVGRDGQSFGPFEFPALFDSAQRGELRKDDFVWRTGMDDWCHAGGISELWRPAQPTTTNVGEAAASGPKTSRLARARRLPVTLKHLLLPWGRTNRRSFWGLWFSSVITGKTGLEFVHALWPVYDHAALGVCCCMLIYAFMAGMIGRLHDHDRTGWYAIIVALPVSLMALDAFDVAHQRSLLEIGRYVALISVVAMIIHIGGMRGTIGPNRFGPDPTEGEHADDYFSHARFINIGNPWMPIYTVLGRAWVAMRHLMEKVGARRIAGAMKRAEEKHELGIQRNLELAEHMGWNRVLYWHGRSVPDPCVHSPTLPSIVAETIFAAFVVAFIGLLIWVAMHEGIKFSMPTSVIPAVAMSVLVAVALVRLRIKKARAAMASFLEMGSPQISPAEAVPTPQPRSATSESAVADVVIIPTAIIGWIGWANLGDDLLRRGTLDITSTLAITVGGLIISFGLLTWRDKLQ